MGRHRLFLFAVLLLTGGDSARAQTLAVKSLGLTSLFSEPSCMSDGVGTAVCAAVGQGRTMIVNRFANQIWSGWITLGGVVTSQPSCFSMRGFQVWCGVRDAEDRLVTYVWGPAKWSGPLVVGGQLADAPSCVGLNTVTAVCTAHSPGGGRTTAYFKGVGILGAGNWTFLPLDVVNAYSMLHCAPNAAALADDYCAWIGDDGGVWVDRFLGQSLKWASAVALGGNQFSPPQCTYEASDSIGGKPPNPDLMWCNAVAGGNFLWENQNYSPGGGPNDWVGWINISAGTGGVPILQASCIYHTTYASAPPGLPVPGCVSTGDDLGDLQIWDPPISLSFFKVSGLYFGTPSCFNIDYVNLPKNAVCVVRQINNTAVSLQLK